MDKTGQNAHHPPPAQDRQGDEQIKAITDAWMDRARPHLDRITGPYASKKQMTIMMLLQSECLGIPQDWSRPDVYARSSWTRRWRDDEEIQEIMAAVRKEFIDAQRTAAAEAVSKAMLTIQMAAPEAAEKLVELMDSPDEWIRKAVADSLLNRAGNLTAEKKEERHGLTADLLAKLEKQAQQELEDWQDGRPTYKLDE